MIGPVVTRGYAIGSIPLVTLRGYISSTVSPVTPSDYRGSDPAAGSPGIQWVTLDNICRFRDLAKGMEDRRCTENEARGEVRKLLDEVLAGPPPAEESVSLVEAVAPSPVLPAAWAETGLDANTRKLIRETLRDIERDRAAAEDEDDVEVLLLTMH